jgi:hypothetical protein
MDSMITRVPGDRSGHCSNDAVHRTIPPFFTGRNS